MTINKTQFFLREFAKKSVLLLLCAVMLSINIAAQKSLPKKTSNSLSRAIAVAPAPTPLLFGDNPTCAKLNRNNANYAELSHITSDYGLKLLYTPPFGTSGPHQFTTGDIRVLNGVPDPNNSVVIDATFSNSFNWVSTKPISAVIVRGGVKSHVYPYPVPTYSSEGLNTPDNKQLAITQVEFCYYTPATVTIIKEVNTFTGGSASTIPFFFTATGFNISDFTLIDNNSQPADRITQTNVYSFGSANPVVITEMSYPNWTLSDIVCTETAGGGGIAENGSIFGNLPNSVNSTYSLATRKANIVLEEGENVTCTFKNVQSALNAAAVSVSGRVLTATGLPLKRAAVSIFNTNTLETKTVYTNSTGYYQLNGLIVNNFYVMTVSHGKRTFANNSRSFSLSDELTQVDFIAQ